MSEHLSFEAQLEGMALAFGNAQTVSASTQTPEQTHQPASQVSDPATLVVASTVSQGRDAFSRRRFKRSSDTELAYR